MNYTATIQIRLPASSAYRPWERYWRRHSQKKWRYRSWSRAKAHLSPVHGNIPLSWQTNLTQMAYLPIMHTIFRLEQKCSSLTMFSQKGQLLFPSLTPIEIREQ